MDVNYTKCIDKKESKCLKLDKNEYKVIDSKKQYLYVQVGEYAFKLNNPYYPEIPKKVKLLKDKDGNYSIA